MTRGGLFATKSNELADAQLIVLVELSTAYNASKQQTDNQVNNQTRTQINKKKPQCSQKAKKQKDDTTRGGDTTNKKGPHENETNKQTIERLPACT